MLAVPATRIQKKKHEIEFSVRIKTQYHVQRGDQNLIIPIFRVLSKLGAIIPLHPN